MSAGDAAAAAEAPGIGDTTVSEGDASVPS